MKENWLHEWHRSLDYRQTKLWFDSCDEKKTRKLLKYGRCKLGMAVQWITGFCNLMRHKHLKSRDINPLCRRCELEEETPFHLSFQCPALVNSRFKCFETWNDEYAEWTPERLFKFIECSRSEELLIDEEDYR